MTKWSQWSLIFIARCILKAATSCTQPKRNVKNRTENPFKLTLSLPFLGPRSVRSSFFLACPGLGLWFEPLGCCKRFVLRSTAIPMDSYGICCTNVFPYVNIYIYIYIIDIIYVCMQCWSHICIYIYICMTRWFFILDLVCLLKLPQAVLFSQVVSQESIQKGKMLKIKIGWSFFRSKSSWLGPFQLFNMWGRSNASTVQFRRRLLRLFGQPIIGVSGDCSDAQINLFCEVTLPEGAS